MDDEILDMLDCLEYTALLSDKEQLLKAVEGPNGGAKNINYTQLVVWITDELRELCVLEEKVTPVASSSDYNSFLMEISAFLKELGCPLKKLTEGPTSELLMSQDTRLLLLHFLLCELQAAMMISANKPGKTLEVKIAESDEAKHLKTMLISLGFPKPPTNITSQQLFNKVEQKVKEIKTKAHPSLIGKPLLNCDLSDKQWTLLKEMQTEMAAEYLLRRRMLIRRLDVTIQSFLWSDRAKQREDDLSKAFRSRRDTMSEDPSICLSDILAAREDLAVLEKTSNSYVRKHTKSNLNKVIIGKVPDRGGRAFEHEPPPPEMPSWMQRQPGGQDHRSGGRGGYGGGADRVQGSWNQGGGRGGYKDRNRDGEYDNRGRNYDNYRGGYEKRRGGHQGHGGGGRNRY